MAELKRTFSKGAMNKDLDERLLPNGQYRDALNVQVSTSEGADVGTLQNILGNKLPYAASIASNLGSNAICIGSIRKDDTECIYWFAVSDTKSLVIEYNQLQNTVTPILVDTKRVLNFSRKNLITGVEILDDFLIWTDDTSEPKIIKITDWKGYTNNAWTHTQVGGGNFEEKHCTVIKEGPKVAPTLKMSKTTREGPISTTLIGKSFTFQNEDGDFEAVPVGAYTNQDGDNVADSALNRPLANPVNSEVIFSGSIPDFKEGDKLKITLLDDQGEEANDDVFVVASVEQAFKAYPKIFKISIDAVDSNIQENVRNWKVELIQKPALFETKFVRFAYRYKYKDGEYSTISPFSQVAFIGDEFDYDPKKGYNLGMVNQLRKLEVRDWAANVPYNVVEVDILYKDSVSNNIYVVKSIKTTDDEFTDSGAFIDPYTGRINIDSELIYKVLPSNQILRPYDNVPKRAKALSVSGNRLMFGNYVENYDISSEGKEITVKFAFTTTSAEYSTTNAIPSVKSQRTYQVGVVYRDKYGRETPVLTDTTGSMALNKGYAVSRNHFRVRITSPIPDWVDTFKYYIREVSQPYYNLAMDRHYPAEDGNTWIAFPSSERNKLQDDSFITLKKEHDTDKFVSNEAKYKVLAIDNEAPDFIKQELVSKGTLKRSLVGAGSGSIFHSSSGYPLSSGSYIDIKYGDWVRIYGGTGTEILSATPVHQLNDLVLVISDENNKTKKYEIANIQYLSEVPEQAYRVNLEKRLDSEDVAFIEPYSASEEKLFIEIFQKVTKAKPEFQGRFFAKIQRDSILDEAILLAQSDSELRITQSIPTIAAGGLRREDGKFWKKFDSRWYWDYFWYDEHLASYGPLVGERTQSFPGGLRQNSPGWGINSGGDIIEIAFNNFGSGANNFGEAGTNWDNFGRGNINTEFRGFVRSLETIGTKFRFTEDPSKDENVYTIKSFARTHAIAYNNGKTDRDKRGIWATERVIRWTLKLDKAIVWSPKDNTKTYTNTPGSTLFPGFTGTVQLVSGLEILQTFFEDDGYTSENPAVFETEPKEVAELDIYYEASDAYEKAAHGSTQRLFYSNCYSFGNGVESDRIRDDFNAPTMGKGVRASTVLEEQYKEVRKKSDIIFSGIYNSTSSVNRLNQFIQAEQITKAINPAYGSIQLMQFRLGKLDVYLEDNIISILSNKDALFNADGSKNVVSSTNVLGSAQPYAGDFGISTNPESYARYGNRAYFSDKNRGVILRLSGNGLEPISRYGLEDYFRDKLADAEQVVGSYDENKKEYALTFTNSTKRSTYDDTVTFKEDVNGWNSRKSYIQENGLSLNNTYYTFKNGEIWSHTNETRNNFYGAQYESSVKFIFNDAPGSVKSFKTLNYEGSQARVFLDNPDASNNPDTDNKFENRLAKSGWWVDSIESDLQSGQIKTFKNKEGKWFYNILGTETTSANLDTKEYSVQGLGYISAITGAAGNQIEIIIE